MNIFIRLELRVGNSAEFPTRHVMIIVALVALSDITHPSPLPAARQDMKLVTND